MDIFRMALIFATVAFGFSAFAVNDNDPGNDFRTCSPGFSRDAFGTCEPDYTFPGGRGHDDDGTPKNDGGFRRGGDRWGGRPSAFVCFATDRRGHTFKVAGRNLSIAQRRAVKACQNLSASPRSCRASGCN